MNYHASPLARPRSISQHVHDPSNNSNNYDIPEIQVEKNRVSPKYGDVADKFGAGRPPHLVLDEADASSSRKDDGIPQKWASPRTVNHGVQRTSQSSPSRMKSSSSLLIVSPVGGTSSGAQALAPTVAPFQMDFMRSMIDEALEEFRDQVRQDVLNLHMEMLKQFQIQQAEMLQMMQQYSVNKDLVAEIERLCKENQELKKKF